VIAPGGNSVATVNVGALTLSTGSLLNYDLTDPSVHDLITVTGTDGLTINGGAVRLYETGTTTAFSANGIYNLINYTGVIGGTGTSALSVDPTTQVGGKSYTFSTAAGSVTLSIATAGNTANFWNVNADGNWTTGTNWTLGSAPNGPSAIASFGGGGTAITAPRTVNLDANQTVGTLNFNSAQSFTVSGANTLTLDNGTDPLAQVTNASGTHTIAVPMALAAATTQFTVLAAADSLTVSGPLSGNTQLVKNGLGTLTLTGANTYLGNNSISGGTLALAGAGTLGDATNVLFMTGGTLNLGGTSQTVGAAVLSGGTISNGTLTPSSTEVSGTGAISITANLAGDGGLTKNGAGSVSLSGNNSYTGTTTVNAGTLIVASANALGAATAPLTFAGGTLQVDGTSFTSLGSRTLTGFPVAVNVTEAAHTVTLDQNLTVTGALVKGGAGKLVVSGTNSFSNATPVSVRAGTLEISGAFTAANGTGNGDIEVAPTTGSAATLRVSTGANVTANRVILGGNTPNSVGAGAGTLIQTGGIVNSRQWFTVGSGVNGLTTGGSGVFTMTGGILNQNAASGTNMEVANFTGTTGVVTMSGSSAINILNNGSINLGANSNAGNGTFTQDGGAVTLFSDAGVTVGGTGALRLGAAGTLPGGSTYTYNLNGGTLTTPSITRNGGGGNASTGVFNFNGGTLIPTASNADFITSALRTNVKAGGAIINTNGLDIRISGNLAHDAALDVTPDGGLIKRGAGILTLGGFSTYTGPTVIEAGTLAVSGGISGSTSINVQQAATLDVTLNSLLMVTGQTLLGDGTVLGTTTMSDGSRLSPGQNIGTLTMAGDLDVSAAVAQSGVAALVFELNSLLASDQVAFTTGALTIGTGVLAFNDFGFTGGPAFGPGTYTLFNGVAPILGTLDPDASNLSGNISGLTGTLGFSDGGNDLVLTVVPEPTASLALLGGLGFLLGLRPRRSARKSA
jgi:autotransporter-associated beta strand protein